MIREVSPLLIGLVCSPVAWVLLRSGLRRLARGGLFGLGGLLLGAAISLFNGELLGQPLGDALGSVALDSLLVGAGAALACQFVVKRLLARRSQPAPEQLP